MNSPELPGLAFAAALVLVTAPLFVLALRTAARLLPARARPAHRWRGVEAVAVCALPFVLFLVAGTLLDEPELFTSLLVNELVFAFTGGVIVVLAARRAGGLAGLGLDARAPARAYLAAPLLYVPWFFVAVGLMYPWVQLCRARGWAEEQETLLRVLALRGPQFGVAVVIVVLLGPLLEELLFRGFLQAALAQRLGDPGALLVTSALFAALHGVAGLPVLFGLSLYLGWAQQRTRCLWVPWSAHALNNAVTLGFALALGQHAV